MEKNPFGFACVEPRLSLTDYKSHSLPFANADSEATVCFTPNEIGMREKERESIMENEEDERQKREED